MKQFNLQWLIQQQVNSLDSKKFIKLCFQSMTSNNEDQDFLDIVPDPTVKQILRKQITEVAFSDQKFNKKLQKTKQTENQLNIIERSLDGFNQVNNNNDYQDYQAELNPYKRDRSYQLIQPERFKKIGYTTGAIRRPIFRMTDLYLPPNDKVQKVIDKIFKQKIYGRHSAVAQFQSQFDNTQQLQKIYNQWETKQDYDEFQNAKNDLDQKDLEQIVVNLGDKKENYFLLLKNKRQKRRVQEYLKKNVKNLPISNPLFLKNFKKAVSQLSQKNKFIEQFQSQQDSEIKQEQKIILGNKSNKKGDQNVPTNKLFGSLKFNSQKSIKFMKNKEQTSSTCIDSLSFPLVDQTISLDTKNKHQKSFNQELIKYYSYSNNQIVNDAHKGPIQNLNRIQYNLANPQFFLPKLHIALQRQQDLIKIKGAQSARQQGGLFGKTTYNNLSQINKSRISDSLFAGNRQAQFSKPSMIQGSGQQIYPLLQDQQQTIQKRIQMQMRNIYKQPLHHSQVAVKFDLVKFTLDQNQFSNYHRNQFLYQYQFQKRIGIKPLFHKSRKIKPKDLIINTEMKNSNIKYSKREALSLCEGQFILIEYIEEHPLVMSNPGMCQRMFIQVNYQEMLEKINQDMIKNTQIDDFQQMRDNPSKNINNINTLTGGNTFQRKCQLWRENIKQNFGQNGKLFLWQPKMAGKLIGSPDGLGVGLMESNLATYPIVKKKPQSRDFLLVREGNKWFIRKIQNMYISGQVQPKKKIFNPDSRQYIVFKTNYEKAFMRKQISMFGSVNFDHVKRTFVGQSQASLKKALKAIRASSNDNKNYTILDGVQNFQYQLTTQDICLYERMQKSICLLKQVGIVHIRNNEKMKNVLKEFNKRHIQSLEKFTISRMIKDQLLLTSWYLTDSFSKFKIKSSKIQIVGMADPTNGKGGYSFINKPQKQRTAREDMEQKNQKPKVSGTTSDLRKLKTGQTRQYLIARGHKQEQLKGKGRWGLVCLMRREENTQYARKERETKPQKAQNQKKQISRVFNKMLAYLSGDQAPPIFNYNSKKKITLDELMQKQKYLWAKTNERILKGDDGSQQGQDDEDFQKQINDEQF